LGHSDPHRTLLKFVLLSGSSLTIMSGAIISPSLPAMLEHFSDIPNAEYLVRLVLTLPALFIALLSPVSGLIIDRFGRKFVLLAGLSLYGITGTSAVLLDSIYHILITRAFLGIAVAAIMTTITTLIADYYDGTTRAKLMGLQAASIGVGGMVYLTTGGFLAEISWNAPFIIYITSLLLIPLAFVSIYEPVARNNLSFDEIFTRNTQSRQALKKVLPLLLGIYMLMLLLQLIFYAVPTQLPFYLHALTGANAIKIGIAIASSTLFSAVASYMYGRLSILISYIHIVIISLFLTGTGFTIISYSTSYYQVLIGLFFSGFGVGLFMPNVTMWLSVVAPTAFRGRALGGLTASIFIGHFLSLIIIQPFITHFGFTRTFFFIGLIQICIALLFLLIRGVFFSGKE
jgi:MFS family permease